MIAPVRTRRFTLSVAQALAAIVAATPAFFLSACVDPIETTGTTTVDAGSGDAGSVDAATADAATSDAAASDAAPDSSVVWADAATTDGGTGSDDAAAPDAGPALPSVNVENRVCQEGDIGEHFCSIPIHLSAPSPVDVVVFVELDRAASTATENLDYRMSSFGITIAAGQTTGEIPVSILGDRTVEPDETVWYRISRATGATIGTSRGSILIVNDDATVPPAPSTLTSMYLGRGFHTATALADGRVILVGGYINGAISTSIGVIEADGTSHAFPAELPTPRSRHSATLLADGRILVVGGSTQGTSVPLATTVFVNPASGTVTPGPALSAVRYLHSAVALADGRVLLAGGSTSVAGGPSLGSAEIFSTSAGVDTITATENNLPTANDSMVSVRAADGSVFLLGGVGAGSRTIVRYVPGVGFRRESASLHANRVTGTATVLPDGRIFVAGGMDTTANVVLTTTELLDPSSATTIDGPTLAEARYDLQAVSLSDGRVVLSGGTFLNPGPRPRSTVEVFDPATLAMRTAFTFAEPRAYHAVVRFGNRLLHIGGYGVDAGGLSRSQASYEVTDFGP